MLVAFDLGLVQIMLTINISLQCSKHNSIPASVKCNLLNEKSRLNRNSKNTEWQYQYLNLVLQANEKKKIKKKLSVPVKIMKKYTHNSENTMLFAKLFGY